MAERRLQRLLVVVTHRCDHGVTLSGRGLERFELGLADRSGSEPGQVREPSQCDRSRAIPKHQEQRLWKAGFDEDVERPATWTGGCDHQLAPLSGLLDLVAADDVN